MQVKVSYESLVSEARDAKARKMRVTQRVVNAVKSASLAVERRVKQLMPRDTGRAAASWGHWTPGDTNNPAAGPGDATWQESDAGLTIKQGSNVEYIGKLNDGWSRQAPAGFIDLAEEIGQQTLDRLIDDLMEEF